MNNNERKQIVKGVRTHTNGSRRETTKKMKKGEIKEEGECDERYQRRCDKK